MTVSRDATEAAIASASASASCERESVKSLSVFHRASIIPAVVFCTRTPFACDFFLDHSAAHSHGGAHRPQTYRYPASSRDHCNRLHAAYNLLHYPTRS